MRPVDYSEILYGSAALAGIQPADIDASIFGLFRTYHDRRLQYGYEIHYWPELCPVEQRYYRAGYEATATVSAGTEVYFVAAGAYYLALRSQSPAVQPPATLVAGNWVVNAAWWAEAKQNYSVADWATGETLIEGDQRRNPTDGRNYQCHTAHTTGSTFDSSKFGELIPFAKYIPYDGTGTALGAAGTSTTTTRTTRTGSLALSNGVSGGTIAGLAFGFTPTVVQLWITRPAGLLNLEAWPIEGTLTDDGFSYELSALTDATSYTLNYEVSDDPLSTTVAIDSGQRQTGTLNLGNGVSSGSVTGLGLGFTPTVVLAWVSRPAGLLNLWAWPVAGSFTADGFDFELNGITDATSYVLNYELSNEPMRGTYALGNGVSSGTVTGLALGFTPDSINAWIIKPSGSLDLAANVVTASISADGFYFELSGLTDSANYILAYQIISPSSVVPATTTLATVVPTPIGEVRRVCQKNPRVYSLPREYRFALTDQGIAVHPSTPNVVWVEFRWRRPSLTGNVWDSTRVYTTGQQVYFSSESGGVGNFYTCLSTTLAGQSPGSAAVKWSLVALPYLLRGYLIQAGYVDWLRGNGQHSKVREEEAVAMECLEFEADKLQRQQKQVRRFDVG